MHLKRKTICLSAALALSLSQAACWREKKDLRADPSQSVRVEEARESQIVPGGPLPSTATPHKTNPYNGNAYALSEGKRLFDWYNCSGCHFHGGGGIGPPLMDDFWIYGGSDENIFDSIVRGRPNGMPSWGGRIPEYQIWQLVTYIKSMSGAEPQSATPARSDEIQPLTEKPK